MPTRPSIAHKVVEVPGYSPEVKTRPPGGFFHAELERAAAYREHVTNVREIKRLRTEIDQLKRIIEARRR